MHDPKKNVHHASLALRAHAPYLIGYMTGTCLHPCLCPRAGRGTATAREEIKEWSYFTENFDAGGSVRASGYSWVLYMISHQVLLVRASHAVAPRKKHCATPTAPTPAPVLPVPIFQTLSVVYVVKDIASLLSHTMLGHRVRD